MERINVQLMLKVANLFINKYLKKDCEEPKETIIFNKNLLFDLFDKILASIPKDTGILRLYGRLTVNLEANNYDKILDLKLREVKSLQTAGWQHDVDQGKKIISTIDELKSIMGNKFEQQEEIKCFIKNTLDTIGQNKIVSE